LLVLMTINLHAAVPAGFSEFQVAGDLTSPSALAIAPDGRVFVAQQDGVIRIIKNDSLNTEAFAVLPVDASGERGLLGIALDPNFTTNHLVYVYYTASSPSSHNRLSVLTANGDAMTGAENVLLELPDVGSAIWHMGGAIHFGPDGNIYLSIGDYQIPADAQSLSVVMGKILRVKPDGTIPTDNPFYGTTTGNNRAIWALGLRNPYTTAFQPGTGRFFINDVGEGSWEEINSGAAGANYGWPTTEGDFNQAQYPNFTRPIHAYPRSEGCAITGGAFYNPTINQFPALYVGKYFFVDFCSGEIRVLDPANNTVADFSSGAVYPTNLDVSPDGSLYYLARGAETGGLAAGLGKVYKIEYTAATPPSIVNQPASQLVSVGQSATFSVSASGTPPLSYQWQRNGANISGATAINYTLPSASMADNGAQFRCVVSNAYGTATSANATLTVTTNKPPVANITLPAAGATYAAGETLNFAGTATDEESGTLPPSAYTWQIDFHHDEHSHPFYPPTSGITSGSVTLPTTGEVSVNVWYRVYLTVTDSIGLKTTAFRDVVPRTAILTLQTSPPGLQIKLDGQPASTTANVAGVVGVRRNFEGFRQVAGSVTYDFVSWSNGGAINHNISFPAANSTIVATYQASQNPDLVGYWRFDEGTATSALDWSGVGNHGTVLGGATWTSGKFGGALSFNGTSSYVRVLSNLNQWLGGSGSVAAWIKTAQSGQDTAWLAPGITGVQSDGNPNDVFYGWINASGQICVSAGDGPAAQSSATIHNNVWRHVVLTRNSASGQVQVYVDGALNAATSETGIKTTPFFSIARIEDTAGSPAYFNGSLDDVRIYKRVLTAQEVQNLFNLPVVSIVATDASAAEFGSDTGSFTISRTGSTTSALGVNYTRSGNAISGADYAQLNSPATIASGSASVNLVVAPQSDTIAEGTETVTISILPSASYALGAATAATVAISDLPIDHWRYTNFDASANTPSIAGNTANPDGDGLTNLLEYALLTNPLQPNLAPINVAIEGAFLTLTYTRRKSPTDITYLAKWSADLISWSSNGVTQEIIVDGATTQTIKSKVNASPESTKFIRLEVSYP
jgi:glucose/arabinose dehydrogenase